MKPKEFRLGWCLENVLADNDPEQYTSIPATRAGFAYALDLRDYRQIEVAGGWGDDGCILYVVYEDEDGDEYVESVDECGLSEGEIENLLTEDGELDGDDVHVLHDSLWDGHNWVCFTPDRCYRWLTDEDLWVRYKHMSVKIHKYDIHPEEFVCDDGWEIFDSWWECWGSESWEHDVTSREEITSRLDAAGLEYEVAVITPHADNEGTDEMILVRSEDREAAEAALQQKDDD